jgi:hypothetical protein
MSGLHKLSRLLVRLLGRHLTNIASQFSRLSVECSLLSSLTHGRAGCVWRNNVYIMSLVHIHCLSSHHDVWVGTEVLNQGLNHTPACRNLVAGGEGSNLSWGRCSNLRLFFSRPIKSVSGDLICCGKTSQFQISFSQTAACHTLILTSANAGNTLKERHL